MYSILEVIIDSSKHVSVWRQDPIERQVPAYTFSMGKSDYLTIKVQIIDVKQNKAQLCGEISQMYSLLEIIIDSSIQVRV